MDHPEADADTVGYQFFITSKVKLKLPEQQNTLSFSSNSNTEENEENDSEDDNLMTAEEHLSLLRKYLAEKPTQEENKKIRKLLESLRDQIIIDEELFVFVFVDLGGMKTLVDLISETGKFEDPQVHSESLQFVQIEAIRCLTSLLNHKVIHFRSTRDTIEILLEILSQYCSSR
jgi:hypothetical protein